MNKLYPGEMSPNTDQFRELPLDSQRDAIIDMLIARRQHIIEERSFDRAWMSLGYLISYLEEIRAKEGFDS